METESKERQRILPIHIDAVLPAGGRISGAFAAEAGVEIKALIAFEGATILRRTIRALRATGRIGKIVVIGPEEVLEEARACGVEGCVAEGATGPDNILRGLDWTVAHGATGRVLITTTDLPFLTPQGLNAFLEACPRDAEIAVPIATREVVEARFPGLGGEYVTLRDGVFTLGSVFLVDPALVVRSRAHLDRIFAARKSPWQIARLIGPGIALRFLTRTLTVSAIVDRVCRILDCRGVPIFDAPAELTFDIDLPEEFAYARAHGGFADLSPLEMLLRDQKETVR